MPLTPGRYYPGNPIRLTVTFRDEAGTPVDPDTVTLKTLDPSGCTLSLEYGASPLIGRAGPGLYFADWTPDQFGVWTSRWETTGLGTTSAMEETHNIRYSPFYDRGAGGGLSWGGPPVSPPSGGDEW